MATPRPIGIDEALVKALAAIVDLLPRGMRPVKGADGKPQRNAAGKIVDSTIPYTGVRDYAVATAFYSILVKRGHALATVKNEACGHGHYCGKCRLDVLVAHSDEAQKRGLLVRTGIAGRLVAGADGRMTQKSGMVLYFRPGESLTSSVNYDEITEKVLALL
jgi:hypothetical protein